jgi:hypothetical protein
MTDHTAANIVGGVVVAALSAVWLVWWANRKTRQ